MGVFQQNPVNGTPDYAAKNNGRVARTAAEDLLSATREHLLYPYKKKEKEFAGVTVVYTQLLVDHGLLNGQESTIGKSVPWCEFVEDVWNSQSWQQTWPDIGASTR